VRLYLNHSGAAKSSGGGLNITIRAAARIAKCHAGGINDGVTCW